MYPKSCIKVACTKPTGGRGFVGLVQYRLVSKGISLLAKAAQAWGHGAHSIFSQKLRAKQQKFQNFCGKLFTEFLCFGFKNCLIFKYLKIELKTVFCKSLPTKIAVY
mgnify:CR=1 FL=1